MTAGANDSSGDGGSGARVCSRKAAHAGGGSAREGSDPCSPRGAAAAAARCARTHADVAVAAVVREAVGAQAERHQAHVAAVHGLRANRAGRGGRQLGAAAAAASAAGLHRRAAALSSPCRAAGGSSCALARVGCRAARGGRRLGTCRLKPLLLQSKLASSIRSLMASTTCGPRGGRRRALPSNSRPGGRQWRHRRPAHVCADPGGDARCPGSAGPAAGCRSPGSPSSAGCPARSAPQTWLLLLLLAAGSTGGDRGRRRQACCRGWRRFEPRATRSGAADMGPTPGGSRRHLQHPCIGQGIATLLPGAWLRLWST